MTSANNNNVAKVEEVPEPAPSKIVELLDRLGGGEPLADASLATGLSQDQARAIFLRAAEIVRRNANEPPVSQRQQDDGSNLDWSAMTIAEVLEILSTRAAKREDTAEKGT